MHFAKSLIGGFFIVFALVQNMCVIMFFDCAKSVQKIVKTIIRRMIWFFRVAIFLDLLRQDCNEVEK